MRLKKQAQSLHFTFFRCFVSLILLLILSGNQLAPVIPPLPPATKNARALSTGVAEMPEPTLQQRSQLTPDQAIAVALNDLQATASGAEVGTNDFRLSDMGPDGDPGYDTALLAVSYNSTDNEYLVVWQGDDDTLPLLNEEDEIFAQRLDAETGAEVGLNDFCLSDMGPDGDPDYDASSPAVAYDSTAGEYLVVWSGDDDTSGLTDDEFEIFGQRFTSVDFVYIYLPLVVRGN